MKDRVTIVFPEIHLPSFNNFYSQKTSVGRRHNIVWKWKTIFCDWIRKQLGQEDIAFLRNNKPLKVTVDISFKKNRTYDVDNCTMYGKLFIDSIRERTGLGYIKDDSVDYINQITYRIKKGCSLDKIVYTIEKSTVII